MPDARPGPDGELPLLDLHPPRGDFAAEVLEGLAADPPTLPTKYLYDERGSALFEQICELPEYYPTRTELAILDDGLPEMAAALGPRCSVVEPGSGSGLKTEHLLAALDDPVMYVPVDISREHLLRSARELNARFPSLQVAPVCADFTGELQLPDPARPAERTVVFFPGSTIGNFEPADASALLGRLGRLCGEGGRLLVGVDLRKSPSILVPAYDDAEGITAEFNLNLLRRLRAELGAELALEDFAHEARWNDAEGRIEMHLVARRDTAITLRGQRFGFAAGGSIHTENSYKHTVEGFARLAAEAGLERVGLWTDPAQLFSVQLLAVR